MQTLQFKPWVKGSKWMLMVVVMGVGVGLDSWKYIQILSRSDFILSNINTHTNYSKKSICRCMYSLPLEFQKFKIIFRSGAVKGEMKFWIVNSCSCQKFKFSPPFAVTFQLHERFLSKVQPACLRSNRFEFKSQIKYCIGYWK